MDEHKKYCKNCGGEIRTESNYCPHCGLGFYNTSSQVGKPQKTTKIEPDDYTLTLEQKALMILVIAAVVLAVLALAAVIGGIY
jgi:uncharacterized membrane protein YvbJ